MKNLKKIAASVVAATAVVSSVAVTASADYQVTGSINERTGCFQIHIFGMPQEFFDYSKYSTQSCLLVLGDNVDGCKGIRFDNGVNKHSCYMLDEDTKYCDFFAHTSKDDKGELSLWIEFYGAEDQNKYLDEIIRHDHGSIFLYCTYEDSNGEKISVSFNSKGDHVEAEYDEPVTFTWKGIGSTSEPTSSTASEPTSSAPTSEPAASAQTSTPASEPAASAPESTAASSENTAKPNPVTGIGGISLTFAAAAIAAGAVVVARKKK